MCIRDEIADSSLMDNAGALSGVFIWFEDQCDIGSVHMMRYGRVLVDISDYFEEQR